MILIKVLVNSIICFKMVVCLNLDIDKIFSKNTDDMLKDNLGNLDEFKINLNDKLKLSFEKFLEAKRSFEQNNSLFDIPEITTTEKNELKFTQSPKYTGPPPPSIQDIRLKMKKDEIKKLLAAGPTQIPSFVTNDDDPNILTQYFDLNVSIPHSRRVFYHTVTKDNGELYYNQKVRLATIMIQFIYMTRRQMGYMTAIREKYKSSYKYMIGYLFGMLRMVRQQQMMIYKTFQYHLKHLNNAQISLQFYYKIVTLNVDVNDLIRYIIRLNYKENLRFDDKYYMDSSEFYAITKSDSDSD